MRVLFLLVIISMVRLVAQGQDSLSSPLLDSTKLPHELNTKVSRVRPDSSVHETRSFDLGKIEQLKNNNDFDYRQPPSMAESLWDRFLFWVAQFFDWVFRTAVDTDWGRILLYALGLVVLTAIIMMLLKVDALRVFYSGADKGSLDYHTFQENIHEMDFEKLIREALEKKEYRYGVRLTFLYALKLLSDKQHVDWRPGKTNHDYLEELNEGELKTGFNELSFYFDYAWYGEFAVNENLFQRVQVIFDNWRKHIR